MELVLSQALTEDAERLCELFVRYIRELENYEMAYTLDEGSLMSAMQGRIRSRMTLAAVARDGKEIVGFLFCSISRMSGYHYEGSPLFGYISDTYVLPEYRTHGVAARLCGMAEQWLRENEVGYMELKVLESNDAAHCFWSRQGYGATSRTYGKKL